VRREADLFTLEEVREPEEDTTMRDTSPASTPK